MRKKTLPSEQIAREISEMVTVGITEVSQFLLKSGALMIQKTLELEAEEFTGRPWYGRSEGDPVYRNGYEPKRITTGEGSLEVSYPQFRNAPQPFSSKLEPALRNRSDTVEVLALQMWVSGLSHADVAKIFRRDLGVKNMSESVIQQLCQECKRHYEEFCRQDLSKLDLVYLFLDGIYLPLGKGRKTKEAILVATGVTRAGRKVLLGLGMGPRESFEAWRSFLSGLKERGLNDPLLAVRDSNPGLIRALREIYPYTAQQVCLAHKMRNLVAKMPEPLLDALKARVNDAFYAKDYATALKLAKQLIKDYRGKAEAFLKCFEKDLDASLVYLLFPEAHWRSIRTTNAIERRFEEVRRRTKVIPHFPSESSALMLCHAVLIEDMKRNAWYGMKMTEKEKHILEKITRTLLVEKQEITVLRMAA